MNYIMLLMMRYNIGNEWKRWYRRSQGPNWITCMGVVFYEFLPLVTVFFRDQLEEMGLLDLLVLLAYL